MLHSMDHAWVVQVKLGGQLGGLRQGLSLAVPQAVARGDLLHRTLAGELLSLGRDRGGYGVTVAAFDAIPIAISQKSGA